MMMRLQPIFLLLIISLIGIVLQVVRDGMCQDNKNETCTNVFNGLAVLLCVLCLVVICMALTTPHMFGKGRTP